MSPAITPLIVACDVDEVLAQLSVEVLRRYNRDYKDNLTPADLIRWEYSTLVKPECGRRVYRYFSQPDLYDHILPYEGALEGVQFLRRNGHRVIFVTSCPRDTFDMKAEWLIRHKFLPDERTLKDFAPCSDKSLINADVLIDDAIHNLETFPKWKVLVSRPHNLRSSLNAPHWRCSDLLQAAHRIDAHLARIVKEEAWVSLAK